MSTGFVLDHSNEISEQIDIIIHGAQYSPFPFQGGTSCFVPAESIYAIFDAKQELSKRTLEETGEKIASVRALDRTSGSVWTNVGLCEGKSAADQAILGGILAVGPGWTEPFADSFRAALTALPENHRLDLGVAISAGAFEVGTAAKDLLLYEDDTALVGFLMALIRKLQPLASALAMDLEVWSRELRAEK